MACARVTFFPFLRFCCSAVPGGALGYKNDHDNSFKGILTGRIVTYAIVETEKGYRILKERTIFLEGMQLRFLYDLSRSLIPDLDMVFDYFPSLDKFLELIQWELVVLRPHRVPAAGEKKLIQVKGFLYYGIRATVFRPELTEEGNSLLGELMSTELFSECMVEMDKEMALRLLQRETYHEV